MRHSEDLLAVGIESRLYLHFPSDFVIIHVDLVLQANRLEEKRKLVTEA